MNATDTKVSKSASAVTVAGASGNAKFSTGALATAHGQCAGGKLAGNAGGVTRWAQVPLEQHEPDWIVDSVPPSAFATTGSIVASGQRQAFGTVVLPTRNITAKSTRVMK